MAKMTTKITIDPPTFRVRPENLSSALVCIGRGVTLVDSDRCLFIQSVFVSPYGQVAFYLDAPASKNEVDLLGTLDYDDLDAIAEGYTYQTYGQAYRIIDIMAACGELSFNDEKELARSAESCMKDREFLVIYKPYMGAYCP